MVLAPIVRCPALLESRQTITSNELPSSSYEISGVTIETGALAVPCRVCSSII